MGRATATKPAQPPAGHRQPTVQTARTQRQSSRNRTHSLLADYTCVLTPRDLNDFKFSFSTFSNVTAPVTPGPQLTFPSIQDGASFRVPQQTRMNRLQFGDTIGLIRGAHVLKFGGQMQRDGNHVTRLDGLGALLHAHGQPLAVLLIEARGACVSRYDDIDGDVVLFHLVRKVEAHGDERRLMARLEP